MTFQRINRTDPEKVFAIYQNCTAATTAAGDAAQLDTGTLDGIRAVKPTTAGLSLILGCWATAYANSSYGLVQIYGLNSDATVVGNTSTAYAAGDILLPVNAVVAFARSAASTGTGGFVFAGAAVGTVTNTTAVASGGVFLKCM
jgi:hypothetical protein